MRSVPSNAPLRRFRDIIENIERIERHTMNMTAEEFEQSDIARDAVERCLARISEAAVKLDHFAEALSPDQPWSEIRGLGNHLRHGYDALDPEVIWLTITDDLPSLKKACIDVIDRLDAAS
jgi:uncharacterized protein with HEPN domain